MSNSKNRNFTSLPSPPNDATDWVRDFHRDLEAIISLFSQRLSTALTVTTKTVVSDYAISASQDFLLLVDASAANIDVSLPSASTAKNRYFIIKKVDATANTVTIAGAEDIDGNPDEVLTSQYENISIISNGIQWYLV